MRKKYISPETKLFRVHLNTILSGSESFNVTDKDGLWSAESKDELDDIPWGW